ncbi:hypothetical protein G7Y89_g13664 [Cudoniella acicularis]|uniref:DUF6594 domain-containing protein n=1 Tax=Cudoniella acicularis TaxID=354080 RepID=A0A8H4VYG5_9HELO|nr:hypothetical protein G7Y89_g13664 [Cudoniella acicularis]
MSNTPNSSSAPRLNTTTQKSVHETTVDDTDNAGPLPSLEVQQVLFRTCFESSNENKWGVRKFEGLALLNLCYYEYELENLEKKIREAGGAVSSSNLASLRSLMKEYDQAVKGFLQLSQTSRQAFTKAVSQHLSLFPSEMVSHELIPIYTDYANLKPKTPTGDQVRAVLQQILPLKAVADSDEVYFEHVSRTAAPGGAGAAGYRARSDSKQVSPFVDRLARVIVAITGGVFLLVPMIIMTFVQNAHLRLVVVSVAVVWFAVSVAVVSESSNQELIGATAAYTAVLVVYVGSTSGGSGTG